MVERASREKCCSIVVNYFLPDIAMLIYFTHIHRLELKTLARSELEELDLDTLETGRNIEDKGKGICFY